MDVKRHPKPHSLKRSITLNTLLYVCKTAHLRHGHFHRRMQIAIVIERYGKTWKSPVIKKLVDKYGAHEC
jgi:hypothetical protein